MAVTSRLRPFGTSVFAEMTALAQEHGAINLSQGFPDFEGPAEVVAAAQRALASGENQYAPSPGHPRLRAAIAAHQRAFYGIELDPNEQVSVTSGATEGIAAAMLGLLEEDDEVILLEPFYDSYPAMAALAGARVRCLTLRFPDFAFDAAALEELVNEKTRLVVVNTPHNPSGKVFTRDELTALAELCARHDLLVLSDEVYEHLVFDDAEHVPLCTIPGLAERTLTLSSAGKLFQFTGWKVGWASGPTELIAALRAAHQFLVFATATPLQLAVAEALETLGAPFFDRQRAEFEERRDLLCRALGEAGFSVATPRGTYFALAAFEGVLEGDDRAVARRLVEEAGLAAIPPSSFYLADKAEGARLLRFAFCKTLPTLEEAAGRLRALSR